MVQKWGGSKGGSFKFATPEPKHDGEITQLLKVKQNIQKHTD